MADTDFLSGGLTDPVIAGQSAFRAIMQAMAEPGTVQAITDCPTPPNGSSRTMAAIATTLCDAATPIWLDPALAHNPQVVKWLALHTGAPVTADSGTAMFAFVSDTSSMPSLDRFAQGTDTYPNGDRYVGEFRNNKRNGQGTFTYADGDKYVGEFRDDKWNGQGTYTYAKSGNKFVGEYRNNKRNGQGTYTYDNGNKYVGEWKNDKQHGPVR